jgi:hypothetical protein
VNELDKVSDESHDRKSDGNRFRDLDIFCQRMSTIEDVPHGGEADVDKYLFVMALCIVPRTRCGVPVRITESTLSMRLRFD